MGAAVSQYSDIPAGFHPYSDVPEGFTVALQQDRQTPGDVTAAQALIRKHSGVSDNRTTYEVAKDQYAKMGEGAVKLITHPLDNAIIPGVTAGAGIVRDVVTGRGSENNPLAGIPERFMNSPTARDVFKGMMQPATVSARGAGAYLAPGSVQAPSRQEFEQAAQGAGANAAGLLAGEAAPYVMGAAGKAGAAIKKIPGSAADFLSDRFKPKPEISALRATGPVTSESLPSKIPVVLNEIAQWSEETGKPADTTQAWRQAIDERMTQYNKISDQIAGPQRDIVVPGSRAELAQAKIEAIPDEVRLNQPKQYANRVKSIRAAADGPEYTIGDLDDLRQDLAAKNKSYGKNISGQISAEHSNQAIDMAAEHYARNKFYDSLFENTGDTSVKDLKSRLGAMIEYDNAIKPRVNESIVQSGKPLAQKAVEYAGKAMTPGTTLKHFGENATINSDLASAARQWNGRPTPIIPGVAKLPMRPPLSGQLALPPATGGFEIHPSAAPLYGPDPSRILRTAVEPGEGIPMRDVTPPKQKMLPSAPLRADVIQRSSGETFNMPAPVKALLDKYLARQKTIGAGGPPSANPIGPSAADMLRSRISEPPIVHQMATALMNDFADMHESGMTQDWGAAKRVAPRLESSMNAGDQLRGRIGGDRKPGTVNRGEGSKQGGPFAKFPESPKELAKAARRGNGPVFERMQQAAREYAAEYVKKVAPDSFEGDTKDWL